MEKFKTYISNVHVIAYLLSFPYYGIKIFSVYSREFSWRNG